MSREIFDNLKENNNLQFRVPSVIKAIVEKEVVNDYVVGEHSEKYTMVHFEQPE